MKYKEEILVEENITEYLKKRLNKGIKTILDVVDIIIEDNSKKQFLRKIILSEFNEFYNESCFVLTKVQEDDKN